MFVIRKIVAEIQIASLNLKEIRVRVKNLKPEILNLKTNLQTVFSTRKTVDYYICD